MANYAALKAALNGQYAGAPDATILTDVNAPSVTAFSVVTFQQIMNVIALNGDLIKFTTYIANPTGTAAQIASGKNLALLWNNPGAFGSFDFASPLVQSVLTTAFTNVQAAGGITATTLAALNALTTAQISQAQLWGWTCPIVENDLIAARAMP